MKNVVFHGDGFSLITFYMIDKKMKMTISCSLVKPVRNMYFRH